MEKMIYFLARPEHIAMDAFKSTLLGDVINEIRGLGARDITVNLAEFNDVIEEQAPGRLMGPWRDVSAVVSFWHANLDERGPIETCLQSCGATLTGYLVTESVVQPFETQWSEGQRRPGITQFGAIGKPENVSDEDFYYNWQVLHSAQSFDLHPLRWSYVRNAVARPLTPDAPTYRALVAEHFRTLEDFTDDSRYFGSQEALEEMIEHMPGFCDIGNMFSLGMSEYYFR
jgi:hypothetical protein